MPGGPDPQPRARHAGGGAISLSRNRRNLEPTSRERSERPPASESEPASRANEVSAAFPRRRAPRPTSFSA